MSVKDKDEISSITKAVRLTEEIIDTALRNIRSYPTESALAGHMVSLMYKEGTTPSFPPIVASAASTSNWHHVPGKKRISKGFLMLDIGVSYGGYASDLTRMAYVGQPSRKENVPR